MARQEGQVQLEQSNMRRALNMAKMTKGGFLQAAIEEKQYMITQPQTKVWEAKMRWVQFPGHKKVLLQEKDTHQWFLIFNWMAANLAKRAQQRICRHAQIAKEQRHLNQNWYHLCPERFQRHLVAITELNVPKLKVWNQHMSTYILLFRTRNISILMYLARIASSMKILFWIC